MSKVDTIILFKGTPLGERAGTGIINLSDSIENYNIIYVCADNRDDGNGFITQTQALSVGYIKYFGYVNDGGGKIFGSQGQDNTSFRIQFNNATTAQIVQEYYARKIRVIGIK